MTIILHNRENVHHAILNTFFKFILFVYNLFKVLSVFSFSKVEIIHYILNAFLNRGVFFLFVVLNTVGRVFFFLLFFFNRSPVIPVVPLFIYVFKIAFLFSFIYYFLKGV